MVKVLNLNLWNYNNFGERKPKIIAFIKKHNPDVIIFQEVRDDLRFNKKGDNQANQLNKSLKYPYLFFKGTDNSKDRPEKYPLPCIEGIAILSRYKFLKREVKKLRKHVKDKYSCENLYFRVKADKPLDFIAVHFSPNELFSKLHLIETLKYIKEKKIKPIIVGDFNMYNSKTLHRLTYKDYKSSIEFKKYISYPPAKFTLDYILIPKEFKFESFRCLGTNLSDHKALIAEIDTK